MYLQMLKVDRDFGLQGGTTRKIYQELKRLGIIEDTPIILDFDLTPEHVKEFRQVFSKKTTFKKGLMSDTAHVTALLEWFLLVNPDYEWTEIVDAAKRYVQDRLDSDAPDMIMRADNFIKKLYEDGTHSSRLLEYLETEETESTNNTTDNWI
jgi:hypothetical protein